MKDKVIELAIKEDGYVEGRNNNNKYAVIAGHKNGLPWCNTFISALFIQAGIREAIPITASCEVTLSWGFKNHRIIPFVETRAGDLVIYDFSGSGKAEHIGLAITNYNPRKKTIETIEGNTGAGSESNGEGVKRKIRSRVYVKGVIRPLYETPGTFTGKKATHE